MGGNNVSTESRLRLDRIRQMRPKQLVRSRDFFFSFLAVQNPCRNSWNVSFTRKKPLDSKLLRNTTAQQQSPGKVLGDATCPLSTSASVASVTSGVLHKQHSTRLHSVVFFFLGGARFNV